MKTRFAILYMNKEKQLFSIREGGDNSIYIFQNVKATTFGGDGLVKVKNQKIAVHSKQLHENKMCNKIKFYLETDSRDFYDKSIIVCDNQRTGFIFPVVNVIEGSFISDTLNLNSKKEDRVVQLFGYLGLFETLCYTIYAHDKKVVMPTIQGFTKVTTDFQELSVTIYFTFLHIPDAQLSLNYNHVEGGLRKNEVLLEDNPQILNRMSVD